jgi:hypothetical protein
LDGLHIVSADIVEVAPAYDTNAELTTMAAADVSYFFFLINFTWRARPPNDTELMVGCHRTGPV